MKTLLPLCFAFLTFSCASKPVEYRVDTQKKYEKEETKNFQKSKDRSELMSQISALTSQIRAVDSQIGNQNQVIRNYQEQPDLPSSTMMIDNAKIRIRHLQEERKVLVEKQEKLKEELSAI